MKAQLVDIFSGIGGFSLAGRMAGWETVQFCETDMFCRKVLSYHWPGVPVHGDIRTLTPKSIINNGLYDTDKTTVLCGGVPCQPWSLAGKRKGTEDDRNLWPESLALVAGLRPEWAVFENVRGFVNWGKGMVFEQVCADLEAEGYEVAPVVLPACGVGAPHRRDRIWIVAYANRDGYQPRRLEEDRCPAGEGKKVIQEWEWLWQNTRRTCQQGPAPHACGQRQPGKIECLFGTQKEQPIGSNCPCAHSHANCPAFKEFKPAPKPGGASRLVSFPDKHLSTPAEQATESANHSQKKICATPENWANWPQTEPCLSGRNDGLSVRLDGITFPKWRNESIKAYGNAIVPQVAYQIFKTINTYENAI